MINLATDALRRLDSGLPFTAEQADLVRPILKRLLSPAWLWRRVSEITWHVADPDLPIAVPHVGGFLDFKYVLSDQYREVSPLDLPGARVELPLGTSSASDWEPETGLIVTHDAWLGFGADYTSDEVALAAYRMSKNKLEDEITIAEEMGNTDALPKLHADLDELMPYLNESKKLDDGDPVVKACRAARDRRRTALGVWVLWRVCDTALPDFIGRIEIVSQHVSTAVL